MVRIVEAKVVGYLTDAFVCFQKHLLGFVYHRKLNMLRGSFAGLSFYEVSEIVG